MSPAFHHHKHQRDYQFHHVFRREDRREEVRRLRFSKLCDRGGSNRHGVTHWHRRPTRLPIPPRLPSRRPSRRSAPRLRLEVVRSGGLEPPRCYPLAPETSASTNSATIAKLSAARQMPQLAADHKARTVGLGAIHPPIFRVWARSWSAGALYSVELLPYHHWKRFSRARDGQADRHFRGRTAGV